MDTIIFTPKGGLLSMQPGFHTPSGYRDCAHKELTEAMEDYLEMICRTEKDTIRIGELAAALQVRPSSATRMAQKLAEKGLLTYNRYDAIKLTAEGQATGQYLLWRHEVLMKFFTSLTGTVSLEEVEQIEHFLSVHTVHALNHLTQYMQTVNWAGKMALPKQTEP